jgi:hypothetical protein
MNPAFIHRTVLMVPHPTSQKIGIGTIEKNKIGGQ